MTFTPLDLTALGILVSFYLVKWWMKKEREGREYKDENYDYHIKKKIVAQTPQGTIYNIPGLVKLFEERTGVYEVRIGVDPVVKIYDEEYWKTWKNKHKHEEDEG